MAIQTKAVCKIQTAFAQIWPLPFGLTGHFRALTGITCGLLFGGYSHGSSYQVGAARVLGG
ncbi:hypothetical protein D0T90_02860 [Neisseria animalis]|uniref:Uncharacterized protein n=1 Tax=Neisseria animalis TaxID=492 RepID=A0A5P3MQ68_NEIAN|nr:hypothetical protein D0T90_02860 [Neisseria animalis]